MCDLLRLFSGLLRVELRAVPLHSERFINIGIIYHLDHDKMSGNCVSLFYLWTDYLIVYVVYLCIG